MLIALLVILVVLLIYLRVRRRKNFQHARRLVRQEPCLEKNDKNKNLKSEPRIQSLLSYDSDEALGIKIISENKNIETKHSASASKNYIVFYVMSNSEVPFAGYELLQSLLSCDLRYGEKNIFHRYDKNDKEAILFSVASAIKPGTFELSKMGSFSSRGLTLFMSIEDNPDPQAAFEMLLETAKQLAEDLAGDILDEQKQPINIETLTKLRLKIRTVCENKKYFSQELLSLHSQSDE